MSSAADECDWGDLEAPPVFLIAAGDIDLKAWEEAARRPYRLVFFEDGREPIRIPTRLRG